jgi:hypothetical protein
MADENLGRSCAAQGASTNDVDALLEEMIVEPETAAPTAARAAAAAEEPPATWRPLPPEVQLDPQLAEKASAWLADYCAFSTRWSPRAFDGFHVGVGLFVLSAVASRRVVLPLGGPRYTNLFIALACRTGLWAKTTTAKIGLQTLEAAGLAYLLAPDDASPQAFVQSLVARVSERWAKLTPEAQERERQRLAFAGQRSWFYEEFGQQVAAMMRQSGFMADFRGLLRRFDDCPPEYRYATVGRGLDVVERPYLAFLANITPADLKPYAHRGANLWGDGFLARFAFITPPEHNRGRGRFPQGERVVPAEVLTPLQAWHERLGIPLVTITLVGAGKDGEPTGGHRVEVMPTAPETCTLGADVFEHYYAYHDALLDLALALNLPDLDGSYVRFAEKALRVAMLLASLENGGVIELRHWAKAQEITEEWRLGLHRLYEQINLAEAPLEKQLTEKILRQIAEHGPLTMRELTQRIWDLSAEMAKSLLKELVAAGELEEAPAGKTTRYRLPTADVMQV